MIAIVDYGVGNLFSLHSSLKVIGADCAVTSDPAVIRDASKVILPGVGAFGDAADKLRKTGLDGLLVEQAESGKPLLGICLGMQLLYEKSLEYGEHRGLGLVKGAVTGLSEPLRGTGLKVPHMGWNALQYSDPGCPLLKNTPEGSYVYFVHSFYAAVSPDTAAWAEYGPVNLTGIVQRGCVYGAQFHPEKSGQVGLGILRAFAEMK